jgi:hypothetical protein
MNQILHKAGLHPLIDPPTEEERAAWPKQTVFDMPAMYADARGDMVPIVDAAMKSCVLIRSATGAVRANHYHRTDWHYCYLLDGACEYIYRPVGSSETPTVVRAVGGQCVFTPPMLEHAMVFTKPTSMLTLGRNFRTQEVYEADIVRIDPLDKLVNIKF